MENKAKEYAKKYCQLIEPRDCEKCAQRNKGGRRCPFMSDRKIAVEAFLAGAKSAPREKKVVWHKVGKTHPEIGEEVLLRLASGRVIIVQWRKVWSYKKDFDYMNPITGKRELNGREWLSLKQISK